MTSTTLTTYRSMSRHPDFYLSLGAIAVGAVVLAYALNLPTLGDGRPGPGLFPGIIASALILFGLALAVRTWMLRRRDPGADQATSVVESVESPREEEHSTLESADAAASGMAVEQETVSTRRAWINGIVMLGTIIGYMALAEHLGFIITMFLVSLVIMLLLKAKLVSAVVTSLALSFGMWLIFERGLQVQLPNGLLW
ncbi:MAG: tripartite tricarboxylate transporter TctB family protein [Micrococcaceae bacterium]